MPYPVSVIAQAFVKMGAEKGRPFTQAKLQKLVYFAQGYHLAKYGEPLIEEEFEAWRFGPVVPAIYELYGLFGIDPIRMNEKSYCRELNNISDQAKSSIAFTWNVTKDLSARTLARWTRRKDSAWHWCFSGKGLPRSMDNLAIRKYFIKYFERAALNKQRNATAAWQ